MFQAVYIDSFARLKKKAMYVLEELLSTLPASGPFKRIWAYMSIWRRTSSCDYIAGMTDHMPRVFHELFIPIMESDLINLNPAGI